MSQIEMLFHLLAVTVMTVTLGFVVRDHRRLREERRSFKVDIEKVEVASEDPDRGLLRQPPDASSR